MPYKDKEGILRKTSSLKDKNYYVFESLSYVKLM